MTEAINIGLTCLITFSIMLVIVIKTYLVIGRRIETGFKKVIGAGFKVALSASILFITFINTLINWIIKGETLIDMYLYILTFIAACLSLKEGYKGYEEQQKIYQEKCKGKRIVFCLRCGREMTIMETNMDNMFGQKTMNKLDIYTCKKCGYTEFYNKTRT